MFIIKLPPGLESINIVSGNEDEETSKKKQWIKKGDKC